MEAQDALSQLADIHLPDSVGWWPPAPGWWLLCLILLSGAVAAVFLLIQRHKRQERLHSALDTLDRAWARYQRHSADRTTHSDAALQLLTDINQTLRRVALLYFPQDEIAGLSGQRWLGFLDRADERLDFTAAEVSCLGDVAYRPDFSGDPEPAYRLAREWITRRYTSVSLWKDAFSRSESTDRQGSVPS